MPGSRATDGFVLNPPRSQWGNRRRSSNCWQKSASYWRGWRKEHLTAALCSRKNASCMNVPSSPGKLTALLQKVGTWYTFVAVTLFSTLLLFVLFNVSLAVAFYFRGPEPGTPTGQLPNYPETAFQAVYPGFSREERTLLLTESWMRPYEYDDFVHFKEAAFQGKYVNVSPA